MRHGQAARDNRTRQIRRVLIITFVANLLVVIAKVYAGLKANSLSVLADAAHSSVDAWNNIMALTLASLAAKAPDEDHPYGHAKFETLGALAIVAFLSITVYELSGSAIARLLGGGKPAIATPLVAGVMAVSAVISFLVARYEEARGREYHSEILLADAAHTKSDVFASLAVLVGIGLVALGYPRADAAFTLLVAVVIARAGWRILKHTVPILVDQRAVEEATIRDITVSTPGVINCFSVRSRGRAGEIFAELTITVRPTLNVEEAHRIADAVEHRVASAVGAREVVVHVEPHPPDNELM
ncbi:MAG TPA: cation diffusion facilitator family transporter [Longimicrobiales bacterium]